MIGGRTGSEGLDFDHAIEVVPQWLLTTINLAGAITIALLQL